MRKTNIFRLGVVALGLTLVAAACGDDDGDGAADTTAAAATTAAGSETTAGGEGGVTCEDITIASFQALSGEAAGLGLPIKQGAELAVTQFNEANPDCQVTFQPEDSQGSPDQAPGIAKKLVDQSDVIGVVGPAFSGESDASGPTFSEAGLITVSPSATRVDLTTKGYKSFVRILGTDGVQGPGLARYISSLEPASVAVIDDASAYGKGLADIVRDELGDLVTVNDKIDPEAQDYSAAVTQVASENPDVVFYGGYYEAAGRLAKQLRDAGVEATLVFGDGVKDQGFIDAGGAAAEGSVISCTCAPAEALPNGADFVAAYTEAFGDAPGTYAAEAYDAASMLLAGISEGITDRAAMLDFIRNIEFEGITKTIKFTPEGDVDADTVYLFEVQGGEIVGTGQI
jgi:branched-chain amino acid transport system substrate-binding protein